MIYGRSLARRPRDIGTRVFQLAFSAAMLSPYGAVPAFAQNVAKPVGKTATPTVAFTDLRRQAPIHGDAAAGAAKAAVCGACHGPKGIAIAPNFPNLAAQSATYLYVQLQQFKSGGRKDPIMSGQVASLSEDDMRNLAAHFAALAPKPAAHATTASRGAQLFHQGDPAKGIAPCQGCHGANGRGPQPGPASTYTVARTTWPALAGQNGLYVTKQLTNYRNRTRSHNSNAYIMHTIAATLDDADIAALALYLPTL